MRILWFSPILGKSVARSLVVSIPDFRRAVRGYDTDDVERYARELSERLERLENERAENARTIQRLTQWGAFARCFG